MTLTKKVLTRENTPTDELQKVVETKVKDVNISYNEVYYLDYEVNEETGLINKDNLVPHYTKDQTERNLKAMRSAYFASKGAVTPKEIITFREKHQVAASVLSLILGFSKNTISNIENEGVTSLSSGRFIKVCLNNNDLLKEYIETCSTIEVHKKRQLLESIAF